MGSNPIVRRVSLLDAKRFSTKDDPSINTEALLSINLEDLATEVKMEAREELEELVERIETKTMHQDDSPVQQTDPQCSSLQETSCS